MQNDLRYPIGKFERRTVSDPSHRGKLIESMRGLPGKLRVMVMELTEAQLQYSYREGGWTIRQLVHHLADSHLNGYLRFKLTLTEDLPEIKLYDQDL